LQWSECGPVKLGSADGDAAFLMKNAQKSSSLCRLRPAVAQRQLLCVDGRQFKKKGVEVNYGLHPVAGRLPGH